MSKTKTNLRLEAMTLGYLHYLVKSGETTNLYSIIDLLVETYVSHLAEENNLDIKAINEEAYALYIESRRPQTSKSKEVQIQNAKKSMGRLNFKKKTGNSMLGGEEIKPGSLKGGF